jgi:hypothetical protein
MQLVLLHTGVDDIAHKLGRSRAPGTIGGSAAVAAVTEVGAVQAESSRSIA